MGFSSWRGRYRGAGVRGRRPQPGRSCVPPAAFPSRGADPPLQSGVPVRRELSVQTRAGARAVPSLAVAAVALALGRRVSRRLPWTLPSAPSRPPTQALAGGPALPRARCAALGHVQEGRPPPARRPVTAGTDPSGIPALRGLGLREPKPGELSSALQRRDGSARDPRSESCPSAIRVGALPSR